MLSETLQSHYIKKNYSEVIKIWTTSLTSPEQDPQSTYIVAASHFNIGNFLDCSKLCSSVDGFYSSDINFLSMYAACLRRQGLYEESERFFLKAIEQDPESPTVLNNYSNLLIDQSRLNEAKEILEQVIKANDTYQDAITNYERLKVLINESMEEEADVNNNTPDGTKTEFEYDFNDPINDAFEVSEAIKCGAFTEETNEENDIENQIIGKIDQNDIEHASLELLQFAQSQIFSKQFNGSLEILRKLLGRGKIVPAAYQIACEAYVGLKLYNKAEIAGLTAFNLGIQNVALLVNLANLSAMRGDFLMSRRWIDIAKNVDSSDENLLKCETLLFPDNSPRGTNIPF